MYLTKQQDIDILKQHMKERQVLIELLNDKLQIIDKMEGELLSGTINIDANSDIRRTCDLTLQVKDKSYLISETSKIWFNKLIRVSCAIKDVRSQEFIWYSCGIYLFNENSYQYDAETNTVSVKCLDMMARLNGSLYGKSGGALTTVIPAGTNIRDAMIFTIKQLGYVDRYLIDEIRNYMFDAADSSVVPYDLEFDSGVTVYDVIIALRDLYPGYETFFDIDGTFICQRYPTCKEDPIVLDEYIMSSDLVISESVSNSFESVYNVTEIWGKTLETDRYTDNVVAFVHPASPDQPPRIRYTLSFDSEITLSENDIVGIKIPVANGSNTPYAIINKGSEIYYFYFENGVQIDTVCFKANKSYVFRFKDNKFYLMGEFQIHAIAMELSSEPAYQEEQAYKTKYNCDNIEFVINPDSPYSVNKIGEKLNVLSSGEYEDIYSDDLALQRAKFENWQTTRLQDGINLTLIVIPWLDVNQKVQYKSQITNQVCQYIVKSINLSLNDDTMTINMSTFYPYYPDII